MISTTESHLKISPTYSTNIHSTESRNQTAPYEEHSTTNEDTKTTSFEKNESTGATESNTIKMSMATSNNPTRTVALTEIKATTGTVQSL